MNRVIKEKQDLTYLSWSKIRNSSGTAGSFLKAYSELGGKKKYYKLSNFDREKGIIGHECVNEIIVDRLLEILGIPHLNYQLIHADILLDGKVHEVYLCCSDDFREPGDSKLAMDAYVESTCEKNETPLEFCIRQGWEEYIYQMLVVDFLILNRDRHGANMEVLRSRKNKSVYPAPLFDHGLSLLFQCGDDGAAERVNVMEDKRVNNYIGSQSTWENLRLIPADRMPGLNPLKESDGEIVMKNLDGILSSVMQIKIWEMIWKRWCAYEDFCNSR